MRWGIYWRISTEQGERGDDDYVSLETQEAGCRAMIERKDPAGSVDEGYVVRRERHRG